MPARGRGVEVRPGEAGTRRVDALPGSARRADPDFDPLEVRAAERAGGAGGDSGSQEAQARASGGGIDDQDECGALDSGDPETFRSGHVEVAFEGFFAAPELVRAPYQRSGDGRIVGDDGANRLPWTGAFGVRHEFSVQTFMQGLLTSWRGCASDQQGMLGDSSGRKPSGDVMSAAASYLHAGNHFRKLGSPVKIDAAQGL